MLRIFYMCLDTGIAAVVLIPFYWILNKCYIRSASRTLAYLLFSLYLCAMFAVVGLPDVRYIRFDLRYNLVPFRYMFSDLTNTLLNVALFLPLGFFLTVFWQKFRKFPRTMLFGFFCSLFIESMQIFTLRATDVNDLITNTFGAFLGWLAGRMLVRFVPSVQATAPVRDIYLICGCALSVMVFLHPFLSELFLVY